MPKPLEGCYELLLTQQELSGSGEDRGALKRMESIVLQRKGQKYKKLAEEPSLLSIEQKKELEMIPHLDKAGPVMSTSSKPDTEVSKAKPKELRRLREVPRTIKARAKAKQIGADLTHKGTGSPSWSIQPWTVYSIWPEPL
ncbi:hypothetical protein O181_109394 [Austropuccinia psidii MF-1]|uniref:Uncharacterized protein n=1 Tax=Austropuccinia psidii MF-1 TaxID=1389203 RepID=A0A9Q3JY09_9BASI|nr:hypothetical protein [Austropuccinia psidii MF-1]